MIYDVILVVIFLLLIIINYFRGAARALAGIITAIVSYAISAPLGKLLAVKVYDAFIMPSVNKAVTEAMNNVGTNAASTVSESLPSWLAGLLKISGTDLSALITGNISGTAESASKAVNSVIHPTAVSFLTFFITILLFFVIMILLRLLVVRPVIALINMAPGIRVINRVLGALIGFVDAFLLVSMMAYLLKLLIPHIGSQGGILNESTIYNSFIFYHFYSGNIFTAILSWLGL